MKDWHLVIVVLGVTTVGVTLLVARSDLLPRQPKLIEDRQDSEGRTVRVRNLRIHVVCTCIYMLQNYCYI